MCQYTSRCPTGHHRPGTRCRYTQARTGIGAVVLLILGYIFIVKPMLRPAGVSYTVVAVVDGDTLDATNTDTGRTGRIRILGIDAPEAGTCAGDAATTRLTELLPAGTTIQLVPDPSQGDLDKYGRILGYVELTDKTDVGAQLITEGYASELTIGEPHERGDSYRLVEATAEPATC